jgi:hypothetical protein
MTAGKQPGRFARLAGSRVARQVYAGRMRDNEVELDLRRTQLLAMNASLSDARRALTRAARISSPFSLEVRAILVLVANLDERVMAEFGV